MIEREDGPVKHYRIVCDSCSKRSKRFSYGFSPEYDTPKDWKFVEVEDPQPPEWDEYKFFCPKCNGKELVLEIIPNVGDQFHISDHEEVPRPLIRNSEKVLVIDCENGRQLLITSNTKIKVEELEEPIKHEPD